MLVGNPMLEEPTGHRGHMAVAETVMEPSLVQLYKHLHGGCTINMPH